MSEERRKWIAQSLAAALAVTNRREPLTARELEVWDRLLSDVHHEDIAQAVKKHLLGPEGMFFPSPAHIMAQVEASLQPDAIEAWQDVAQAISRMSLSVEFIDQATAQAVHGLGGLYALAHDSGLQYLRGRFETLYIEARRRPRTDHPAVTPGRSMASEDFPPVKIGRARGAMRGTAQQCPQNAQIPRFGDQAIPDSQSPAKTKKNGK